LKSNNRFDKIPKLFFMQRTGIFICIIALTYLTSSCGGIKELQYAQGNLDSAALVKIQFTEPVIQKGDMITITTFSDDPLATASVTSQMPRAQLSGTVPDALEGTTPVNSPTYIVDQSGNIRLYKLGVIHVEGMLKKQLGDTIAARYEREGLLKNPFVEVRFINYRISLIGEVSKPGVYIIPGERLSIF
jgi:polysaccharide export outer membrane protein